jgi:hypothetical protein
MENGKIGGKPFDKLRAGGKGGSALVLRDKC